MNRRLTLCLAGYKLELIVLSSSTAFFGRAPKHLGS